MGDEVVVHEYGEPGAPPMVLLHGRRNPEPEIRRTRAETSLERGKIAAWAACKTQVDRRLIHHLHLGRARWRDLIGSVERPTLGSPDPGPIPRPSDTASAGPRFETAPGWRRSTSAPRR